MSSQRDLPADDLATPEVTATSPTRRQIREQERAAEAAARAAEYVASLAQAEAVDPTDEPVGPEVTTDAVTEVQDAETAPDPDEADVVPDREDTDLDEDLETDEDPKAHEDPDPDEDSNAHDVVNATDDGATEDAATGDAKDDPAADETLDDKVAAAVADPSDTATTSTPTSTRSLFRPGGRRPAGGNRPAGRKSTTEQPRVHRWVPRLAVLAALGIATTVVPLTGAALPDRPSAEATTQSLAAASALDILAGGAYVPADGTQALAADPEARARALAAASRDNGSRDELTCGTAGLEANGVVAAETTVTPVDLVMPITAGSYSLTSRYGYRSHPIYGSYSEHTGLDMAAAAGTPIHSIADGEVIYAGGGKDGRSGMLVIVQHEIDGEPIWSWYVHMYPNGVFVDVGDVVTAGEVIGAVGSYGNSTGPHLHLEIHLDEALTTVDPEAWLAEHEAAPLTSDTPLCSEG
ncbi:peptidoglycan DD-metalloendopeptidase family protein [Occultella kanbiaonis]|uniref:peptidoglycan DD-metalloendopeptidase family protein n=1 Tax=Occultella kanbiaonis TaxID=2675754 RepID=UPI0012B810A1|nr:peptidoglycan DD-metalloendopeptidase family protein [Occultella kanbiaonis]